MRDWTNELNNRSIQCEELLKYGFTKEKDIYSYRTKILEDCFEIVVSIHNNNIKSMVYDLENNCEYILVNVLQATGEFVGKVKEAYEKCIQDIIAHCTVLDVFHNPQTKEIIEYIQNKYQDELEFLWENFSENAIWRNKINQKWYGILFRISKRKIGIASDEKTEAINLLFPKDQISAVVDYQKVFPGYHMNKKSWITIQLDRSLDNETLCSWIDVSYQLSLKK